MQQQHCDEMCDGHAPFFSTQSYKNGEMCFIKRISLLLIVAYCRERGKGGGRVYEAAEPSNATKKPKEPQKGGKSLAPTFFLPHIFSRKKLFQLLLYTTRASDRGGDGGGKKRVRKGETSFPPSLSPLSEKKSFFSAQVLPLFSPSPKYLLCPHFFFHRGGDAFLIAGKLLFPTMRALLTSFLSADPFTTYRIVLRAFTKKREGPASDALFVATDTAPPAAPIITNLTCHGADGIQVRTSFLSNGGPIKLSMYSNFFFQAEMKIIMLVPVQVEWRRPSNPRLVSSTPIHHYVIHLRPRGEYSSSASKEEDVEVEVMNDTVRNVAFLSNLTRRRGGGGAEGGGGGGAVFDLSVSAFVESSARPGRMYRGPPSLPR